jgi:OOP family OmpA-OmpF porin
VSTNVDTLLARCHHEFNYLGARVRWYGACSTPDAITHITESIMRKVVVLTVSFIGGLGAALGAHAEEQSGFYLGGSVGQASNESGQFKGSDFAFKVSGGYAFNEYFGLELAYVGAGAQKDNIGLVEVENKSNGVLASTLLRLPLGETFAMFGKIGYAFYDSATTSRLGSSSERETDNGKDFAYGIGIDLTISGGLKFRAEFELVDVSEGDFQIVSAGAVYKF